MKKLYQNLITLIVVLLILVLVGYNLYTKFYKFVSFEIDSGQTYYTEEVGMVYVFYEEEFYDFNGRGSFNPITNNGRIPVGTRLGSLEISNVSSIKKQNGLPSELDIELQRKNLLSLSSLNKIYENSEAMMQNKINILLEDGENRNMDILSKSSGYFLDSLDGYEEILSLDKFDRFKIEDLKLVKQPVENVKELKNAFKIVNNNIYYAIIDIDDSNVSPASGDKVTIVVNEDESITGTIIDSQNTNKHILVKAMFNTGFDSIVKKRILEAPIIMDKQISFKVPSSSVFESEEGSGVMRVNHSGFVEFVPVEKVKEEDNYTIVSAGIEGLITVNSKEVSTLKAYDEILIHPKSVKVGDAVR